MSNSGSKNYIENIEKADEIKKSLEVDQVTVEDLIQRSQMLKAFGLRKQKLRSPKNVCKCLIDFTNAEISLSKNEECVVEENVQRAKWKVLTNHGQTVLVPSVCFTLQAVDEDAVNAAEL